MLPRRNGVSRLTLWRRNSTPRPISCRRTPAPRTRRSSWLVFAFIRCWPAAADPPWLGLAVPDGTVVGLASAPGFGPPAEAGEVGTLGPYRVVRQLGRGGSAVYEALDVRLNRKLALKHDNVVTVYEADERDGVQYIAMQFLEGCSLGEYLRQEGLPERPPGHPHRSRRRLRAGGGSQERAHPPRRARNLWLECSNGRVKLLDFGLVKPARTDLKLDPPGRGAGYCLHVAGAGTGGQVDHRSDLFSLVLSCTTCAPAVRPSRAIRSWTP